VSAGWKTSTSFIADSPTASQKYNFDRHIWDVKPSLLAPLIEVPRPFMAAIDLLTETFCQNSWIAQLFFLLSTCSIKVSILLFYRRLDAGTHSWFFSCAVLAAIGAIVAYALAFVLILIFQCRPLDSYWLRFAPNYTGIHNCTVNEPISLPVSAYLSVVTDFLALLLPFWLVWNMKLPRRQKWSLYAIFGLGLV